MMQRFAALYPYYEKNRAMGMYDLRLRGLARGALRASLSDSPGTRHKLRRMLDQRTAVVAVV
jgi:hypothetical protein